MPQSIQGQVGQVSEKTGLVVSQLIAIGWTRWPLKVSSNLNYSIILLFYKTSENNLHF